jgi:predicted lipid-binding transport protein (Tim44 family)
MSALEGEAARLPAYGSAPPSAYIIPVDRAATPFRRGSAEIMGRPVTVAESMQNVFDIYTIIFLALAVFIFLRLRSVLGQRTGRERPPYDPYSAREPVRPATEKVVTLPPRTAEPVAVAKPPAEAAAPAEPGARWKDIAEAGSPLAAGLDAIAAADSSFDARHFVAGARSAYELIVTAYAEGDRRSLKNLLSRDVYDGFEGAISEREKRGETVETRFVSIDAADLTAAELRARTAQVTVRFHSKLITATRDKNGNVVDGSAERVSDVTDVWTFARDVSSRDPNWKLVATEAGH